MLKLLIEDDDAKQSLFPLVKSEITIGRKEGNTIRLTERNVSRFHARIVNTPSGLFLENVNARYGTKLNGKKIEHRSSLHLGDEFQIGDYKFYIQDGEKPNIEQQDQDHDKPQPIQPVQQPKFVVISSNFTGKEYFVTSTITSIGRNPNNTIQIDHRSVSSNHAIVRKTPKKTFVIEDNQSANGIKINGQFTKFHELNSGDIVELGHVRMRYCAPGEFWFFQFEKLDNKPDKSKFAWFIAIIIITIVVAVASVIITTVILKAKPDQSPPSLVTQPLTPKSDQTSKTFQNHKDTCIFQIGIENIQEAKISCEQASKIKPDDTELIELIQKIDAEEESLKYFNMASNFLDEKQCDKASEQKSYILPKTIAYRKYNSPEFSERMKQCKISAFYNELNNTSPEQDSSNLETQLFSLLNTYPKDPDVLTLRNDFNEKFRPQADTPSRTDKKNTTAKNQPSQPQQPPAPKQPLSDYIEQLNKNTYDNFQASINLAKQGLKDYPDSAKIRCKLLSYLKIKASNAAESIDAKCAFKREYEKSKTISTDDPEHLKDCFQRINPSQSLLDVQCQ